MRNRPWNPTLTSLLTTTALTLAVMLCSEAMASDRDSSAAGAESAQASPTATGIAIDHPAVGCVVADKYPRFEARFDPAEGVREARVYFRPDGHAEWYYVVMTPGSAADTFWGVLPKPQPTLEKLNYYIEVMGAEMESGRTEEYAPDVVAGLGACKDRTTAGSLPTAVVRVLSASSGASPLPPGFSAVGVTPGAAVSQATAVSGAAGGGISNTVLIGGGVVLVGGAAVALAAGGDDSGDEADAISLSGHWTGTYTIPQSWWNCTEQGTWEMTLTHSGSNVAGTATLAGGCGAEVRAASPGDSAAPMSRDFSITGTVASFTLHLSGTHPSRSLTAEATFTSNQMNGNLTETYNHQPATGTFQLARQ